MTWTADYGGKRTVFVGRYGQHYSRIFERHEFYEFPFLKYVASLNLRGDYLDVGGNIGNHALFFATHCAATKVYTFEPLERYQKYIVDNIEANRLTDRIELCPFGLSDSDEQISFMMNNRIEQVSYPKRLDDVDPGFSRVAVMKIDVEGAEKRVILGGLATISRHRPRIFCEVTSATTLAQIDQLLAPYGYERTGNVFNPTPTYEWAA
jgi:FkbM family methyltransferase